MLSYLILMKNKLTKYREKTSTQDFYKAGCHSYERFYLFSYQTENIQTTFCNKVMQVRLFYIHQMLWGL